MAAGIVAFDWQFFTTRYPELAGCGIALAQAYFGEAELYCDNTGSSPVADGSVGGQRYRFLHMLTAHICALNSASSPQASPLVGRISNATEGSVSVQTQLDYPPGTVQWYQQTKYGAAFWAASLQYRQMLYVPGPRRNFEPYPFGRPDYTMVSPVNPGSLPIDDNES